MQHHPGGGVGRALRCTPPPGGDVHLLQATFFVVFGILFTLFHRQFHSYGARRALAKKVDDLLKVENHEFTDFSERLLNLIFISWSTLTSHMSSYDIASHEPIHIGMPCGAWRTAEKGRMAYTAFAF